MLPSRIVRLVLAVALVAAAVLPSRLHPASALAPLPQGLWLAGSDGGIFTFGDAEFLGSTGAIQLNKPIVGMASTPSGLGYWLVASDGGIFSFGDARFVGSTGAINLNKPIVGMAATPTGDGYWLVASDGGIFAFGDATFTGSTGAIRLNKPIVGMASTPSGLGYWLVASDGGIFSFGDARFTGSTGAITLNKPIVGMASTPTGDGYWLVANDGGVFSFGDAAFHGSAAASGPAEISSIVRTATGRGYWQTSTTGRIYAFGDAESYTGVTRPNRPLVAAAPVTTHTPPPGPTPPTANPLGTMNDAVPGPALNPAPLMAGRERPNVLLVVMDDMRAEPHSLAVMDKTREWLVDGGTTYVNGYANTPLCCPERATIFSGRYMHNHGIEVNGQGTELDQTWTMARYLKDAGYQTGLAGKFLVGWDDRDAPPHYDTYAITNGGYLGSYFNVNGDGHTAPYSTDFMQEISVEFLQGFEADDAKPWYLHVTPQAPHDSTDGNWYWPEMYDETAIPEYEPSPAALDMDRSDQVSYVRDKTQSYEESKKSHDGQMRTLMAADDMIDGIFRQLESSGELDNTLVIFTSDNGYSWGERGVTSKGLPYVESVKVPFLVRWPGIFAEGATVERPVGGVDLLPTLLEAAGYEPPVLGYPLDGRSLFHPGGRDEILLEMHEGHRGIPNWASLRNNRWQYIEYYESDETTVDFREYYDLGSDPWQLTNLLEDADPTNDPDVAALSAQLATARTCAGAACP
jgi:arylsulfatase A-like enzyme